MIAPSVPQRAAYLRQPREDAERLYEVSRLLARFVGVDETIPAVLAVVRDAIELRTSFVVVTTDAGTQSLAWKTDAPEAEQESSPRMRVARTRARAALAYYTEGAKLPIAHGRMRANFVALPLAVEGGAPFGVVQFEACNALDERDLGFLCEVVREIAAALHRHARDAAASAVLRERAATAERATAMAQRTREDAERGLEAAERAERTARFLAELSMTLASAGDAAAVLSTGRGLVVPFLADVCWLDVDSDGGSGGDGVADRTPQSAVLASGEPFFVHNAERAFESRDARGVDLASLRALGIQSIIVVPIQAHGVRLGALSLVMSDSRRHYSASDVVLAKAVAAWFAIALDAMRAREASERALRGRREVLTMVSHDLRSPLQAILVTTHILITLAKRGPSRPGEEYKLALITRSCNAMGRMLDDLHDSSNIDTGRLAVNLEPCLVADVLGDAAEALRGLGAANDVDLEFRAEREGVRVLCDRRRVLQILTNLVGNAVKFSDAGGGVSVTMRVDGPDARFEVRDDGAGIAVNDVAHLFEPYWRGVQGPSSKTGLGLGLYISKTLVEAQHGLIGAERNRDRGSTFFFTLPIFPAAI